MGTNESSISIHKGIYISLDEILDTRLSTLLGIDTKVAEEVIANDAYTHRIHDEFSYIPNMLFRDKYDHRPNSALRNTFLTKVIDLLSVEADLMVNKKLQAGEPTFTNIDVNIFPYTVSDTEKNALSIAIHKYIMVPDVNITFIDLPLTELTLNHVNSLYDVVFMYDGIQWLDYHIATGTGSAPTTKMYSPSILMEAVVFNSVKDIENVFNSCSEVYGRYINYTAVPSEFFSFREVFRKIILKRLEAIHGIE